MVTAFAIGAIELATLENAAAMYLRIRPERSRMLYLAGIYHLEKHDDVIVPTFTVLTREASPGISFIHDRMPVILPPEITTDWLDSRNDAVEVIQAAMLDMEYHPA